MIDENDEDNPSKMKKKLKDLFRMGFQFLTNFVKNNQKNQEVLGDYLVVFSLGMKLDLGQVELFNEIFRDNQKLCVMNLYDVLTGFVKLIIINGR